MYLLANQYQPGYTVLLLHFLQSSGVLRFHFFNSFIQPVVDRCREAMFFSHAAYGSGKHFHLRRAVRKPILPHGRHTVGGKCLQQSDVIL